MTQNFKLEQQIGGTWYELNDSSGIMYLNSGINPVPFGQFESTSNYNFSVYANTVSTGTNIRCSGESRYVNATSVQQPVIVINDVVPPTVTLQTPANNTTDLDGSVIFTYLPNDNGDLDNCSLYLNGVSNATNTSVLSGVSSSFAVSPLTAASYNWSVACFDTFGNRGNSMNRTIHIDQTLPTVNLMSPINNSGDNDGVITFSYNVSDPVGISSCGLYIDSSLEATDVAIIQNTELFFADIVVPSGQHNWTVQCTDSTPVAHIGESSTYNVSTILTTDYDVATDFTPIDVRSTAPLYLEETIYGWINYTGPINLAPGPNLNTLVNFASNFVQARSDIYNALNASAQVRLEGLSFQTTPVVYQNGNLCSPSICSVLSYTSGSFTFNVTEFSNFTAGANSQLELFDQTDPAGGSLTASIGSQVYFYANYTNITSTTGISGATCNVEFNESGGWTGPYTMTYNASTTLYVYNRTFASVGTYNYRATCNGTSVGFENASATADIELVNNNVNLVPTAINLDNETLVEEINRTIQVSVNNTGSAAATNYVVQLTISLWNGTSTLLQTLTESGITTPAGGVSTVNFSWTPYKGTYIFNATVDSTAVIAESNEADNSYIENRTVSSYQIYYGTSTYAITLNNNVNEPIQNWSNTGNDGILYYADADSSYFPFNLAVLDAASNDFEEADAVLNMSGLNDSIRALFDSDDNNVADLLVTRIIGGNSLANIPVTQSTNTSNFLTGILYDTADGFGYNGSQDLVFVTWTNASTVGAYGTYDFEIRVPSSLKEVFGATNAITQLFEQE